MPFPLILTMLGKPDASTFSQASHVSSSPVKRAWSPYRQQERYTQLDVSEKQNVIKSSTVTPNITYWGRALQINPGSKKSWWLKCSSMPDLKENAQRNQSELQKLVKPTIEDSTYEPQNCRSEIIKFKVGEVSAISNPIRKSTFKDDN